MKTYLIEARWYSPTSYEIYHYGLAEVEADSSTEAYEKAAEVFKRHGKTLKLGPEPVSFRIVSGAGYEYGKGYDPRVDKVLKENPLSKSLPRWIVRIHYRGPINRDTERYANSIVGKRPSMQSYSERGVRVIDWDMPSRTEAEAAVARLQANNFYTAKFTPGRRAPDSEIVDWDFEHDKPKGTTIMNANPLSLRGKEAVIGIGLAAGIGAAIYYMSRPAAAATSKTTTTTTTSTTTSTPGTITLSPGTVASGATSPSTVTLSATIPLGGLYVALPPGGVWTGAALAANATAAAPATTPLFIPNTTGPAQTSLAQTLTWTDSSGTPQFTSLTTTTTAS